MFTRREISGALAAGAVTGALTPSRAVAQASLSRKAEVQALRQFAEATHPRGAEAKSNTDWVARWNHLELNADTLSDGAYFVETRRALGWFKDGHTTVLPFEFTGGIPEHLRQGPFGLLLPFRVRVFEDGAFIIATTPQLNSISGARIDEIGSISASALIQSLSRDWPGNRAWVHRWSGYPFSRPALLQGLGACSDPNAAIRVRLAKGNSLQESRIRPIRSSELPMKEIGRSLSRSERAALEAGTINFLKSMPDAKTLYVRIDEMADVEGMRFEKLAQDCKSAFEAPEYQRLIIDLRLNGGGDNYLGESLRRIIATSRFNKPGKLYVMIGPRTFSAAQNLANRLERETFALFVGAPTGGEPNMFGDAAAFVGSSTGLTSIVSTISWFDSYPHDKRSWIMPDLPVPENFSDWLAGRDPALDQALVHQPKAMIDEFHADRIFYYKRKSQSSDWQPFWESTA